MPGAKADMPFAKAVVLDAKAAVLGVKALMLFAKAVALDRKAVVLFTRMLCLITRLHWTRPQAIAFTTTFRGMSDHLALSVTLVVAQVQSCKKKLLAHAMLLDAAA